MTPLSLVAIANMIHNGEPVERIVAALTARYGPAAAAGYLRHNRAA